MGAYLGNTEIGQMFLGGTEIAEAYLGSTKVWEKGGAQLPYDAEVEYLQSSGTQYVDTGLFGDIDLDFECVAKVDDNNSYYNILGDRASSTSQRYSLMAATSSQPYSGYVNCGNENQINFSKTYTTTVYRTYKKSGLDVYIDNNLIGTFLRQTFTTPNTIILFGCRNNGSLSSMLHGKICSCKLSKNGVMQRDYIPVRVGTVGYMYDKVSGQLFGNSGTGNFVLGNDV